MISIIKYIIYIIFLKSKFNIVKFIVTEIFIVKFIEKMDYWKGVWMMLSYITSFLWQ